VFTIVHYLAISDTWFSLLVMLAAGALSGELFALISIIDAVFASALAGLGRQTLAPGGGA
jgi:hypothetical protein